MTANIQISDLDPVGVIDPLNDLLIIRQGLVDKKALVFQIQTVAFQGLTISASPLQANDLLIFGKNNGNGTYSNYAMTPERLGFLEGTQCWFYSATAPDGWQIVAGTGDRILGTVLGSGVYDTAGLKGTWQQQAVDGVPNRGLSVKQIPNHQHFGQFGRTQSDSEAKYIRGSAQLANSNSPRYSSDTVLGIIGGAGDIPSHDAFGACDPHNHGALWRPSACIGNICIKTA